MAKMTKAQARRRLQEALKKVKKVFVAEGGFDASRHVINYADMSAIERILNKAIRKLR